MGSKGLVLKLVFIVLVAGFASAANTSLYAVNFTVSDFSFASGSYVTGITETFNTTESTNLVLMTSMNVQKLSGGGAQNDIYVRVKVDGTEVLEELIRSIKGTLDEGSTGTKPVHVTVAASPPEHNITMEFKRTGRGSISVNDVDMILGQLRTVHGNSVRGNLISGQYTHSSSSFEPSLNFTINKTISSPTFILTKETLTTSAADNAYHYFEHLDTGQASGKWARYLADSNDVGSVSGQYMDVINDVGVLNYTIQARTNNGKTITNNYTILDFDTRDNSSNLINNFYATNALTNVTSYVDYSASGVHNLVNSTVVLQNGTAYFLAMQATAQLSAGTKKTPTFFVNATGAGASDSNCYSKKERYLDAGADIGNIYIFTLCVGLTPTTSYTFHLWLDNTVGNAKIRVLDESLAGFEVTPFSAAQSDTPPIADQITSPENGTYPAGVINITWKAFFDPNGDAVAYNVSRYNSGGTFNATINSSTTNNYTNNWNTSGYSDGVWKIYVEGCDGGGGCSTAQTTFTIDNTAPSITATATTPTTPVFNDGSEQNVTINFTSSEYPINTTIYLDNGTIHNQTSPTTINNSSELPLTYTIPNTLTDGNYTLYLNTTDPAGNTNQTNLGDITVDSTPPAITAITTTPTLPMNNDGSEQNVAVNFTSDTYPINVTFNLYNSTGSAISTQTATVTSSAGLPLNFTIPAGLAYASYTLNMSVADSLGNANTTALGGVAVTLGPAIGSVGIYDTAVVNGTSVKLFINATYVSNVWANITLPNSTVVTVPLGNNTNTTFSSTGLIGRYNVTFYGNDTSGAMSNTTSYFLTGQNISIQFNAIDGSLAGISVTLNIYLAGGSTSLHEHTFVGNETDFHADVLYDLLFTGYSENATVLLRNINISVDNNKTLGFDRLPTPASGYLATYGLNSTYSFANATLTISYGSLVFTNEGNLKLYKCDNYNFAGRACSGSWADVTGQATQDTANNNFSITVNSFSGFGIKEVTPATPGGTGPAGPLPESSGDTGGAAPTPQPTPTATAEPAPIEFPTPSPTAQPTPKPGPLATPEPSATPQKAGLDFWPLGAASVPIALLLLALFALGRKRRVYFDPGAVSPRTVAMPKKLREKRGMRKGEKVVLRIGKRVSVGIADDPPKALGDKHSPAYSEWKYIVVGKSIKEELGLKLKKKRDTKGTGFGYYDTVFNLKIEKA